MAVVILVTHFNRISMKAAWFEEFGAAGEVLQIGKREKPNPSHGEVLVKLKTSGVNPSDVKKRAGSAAGLLDAGPVIPHSDGAGIIEEVGVGVPDSRLDERVWIYNAQLGRQHGTAAEYVTVPSEMAIRLPDKTDYLTGACMGIPAMTAHRCVFADGPVKDQIVLITGGSGRVGHYAVQMAKLNGATVIATAGSDNSKQFCLDAGADIVIDHPGEGTSLQVLELTGGERIDRLVEGEFGKNLPHLLDCMKTGGTIASYASMGKPNPAIPFYKIMYLDLTIRFVIVYAMPATAKEAAIDDITLMLENEQLTHRIADSFSLKHIARAHELVEGGDVRGCVILKI